MLLLHFIPLPQNDQCVHHVQRNLDTDKWPCLGLAALTLISALVSALQPPH